MPGSKKSALASKKYMFYPIGKQVNVKPIY